jgi:eight-cysteine-cluster-containing protein
MARCTRKGESMLRVLPLFFVFLTACGAKSSATAEPAPTEEAAPAPDPVPEVEPEAEPEAEAPTPASLYAECQQRVEGKQVEGECEKDEDCKTAGCGTEVCVTVANAADVMTTCEDKLCFKVLDTCGCNEGQCTWSLKDEIPAQEGLKAPEEPAKKLPPTRLPPSAPPAEGGAGGE